jgi:hypothetical protein
MSHSTFLAIKFLIALFNSRRKGKGNTVSLFGDGDPTCYVYPITFIIQNFCSSFTGTPSYKILKLTMNGVSHPFSQAGLTATLEMLM